MLNRSLRRIGFSSRCAFTLALTVFAARAETPSPLLLVAGYGSDNVVTFDPQSGNWTQLLQLKKNSRPRGLTIGDQGELYLGLHSQTKDVVRFSARDGYQTPTKLTRQIGRFGPGILAFHPDGIYTSSDTERVLLRIDPGTGQVSPLTRRNCCNMVGILRIGDRLLAGEYFQRSILQFDLGQEMPAGRRLVDKSPHLNRPMGLVVGHNGSLFVSNGLEPTVVEFDIETGAFIGTFINLGAAAKDGIYGLAYVPGVDCYYLTTGSDVHEVDRRGDSSRPTIAPP